MGILKRLILLVILPGIALAALPASAQTPDPEETPSPTPSPGPSPTPTPGEARAAITGPEMGDNLSGTVAIEGTATAADFRDYVLEFAPDPSPSDVVWQPIQGAVEQQVRDDVLGVWDTTGVEDGRYILRLTVRHHFADPTTTEVRIFVANATATPQPQPITPTPPAPPGSPTPGPSPTSLIEQPPTRTPRAPGLGTTPTATPGAAVAAGSPLQPDRLRRAAVVGVLSALAVFGLFGFYRVARAGMRGQLGDSWRQFRSEVSGLFRRRR
jgi:hypothetical protein